MHKRNFKDYIIIAIKGMAMGAADVVPGVSGGTMAFILGIYEELVESIRAAGRPPMAVGGCRCQAAARASQGIGVASLLSALVASQRRGDRFWAVH